MLEHLMLPKGIPQNGVGLDPSESPIDELALLLLVCSTSANRIEHIFIQITGSEKKIDIQESTKDKISMSRAYLIQKAGHGHWNEDGKNWPCNLGYNTNGP